MVGFRKQTTKAANALGPYVSSRPALPFPFLKSASDTSTDRHFPKRPHIDALPKNNEPSASVSIKTIISSSGPQPNGTAGWLTLSFPGPRDWMCSNCSIYNNLNNRSVHHVMYPVLAT